MLLPVVLSAVLAIIKVSAEDEPEIVGEGTIQVSIQFKGQPIGVGVIIDPQFVLTTWTLLKDKPMHELKVVTVTGLPKPKFTTQDVKRIESTANYPYVPYEIKIAPNNGSRPIHDLAIIQVAKSFDLARYSGLTSVPIADKNYQPSEKAESAIYSLDSQLGSSIAFFPLIKKETCNEVYKLFGGLVDGEICAGGKSRIPPYAKFAAGDEGTPLVVDGSLFGIASWVAGTSDPDYPVFTDIRTHYDFINGSIADMLGTSDGWFKYTWEIGRFRKGLINLLRYPFEGPPVCEIGPQRKKIRDDICSIGCEEHNMDGGGCDDGICLCLAAYGDRPLWDILTNTDTRIKTCLRRECKFWK